MTNPKSLEAIVESLITLIRNIPPEGKDGDVVRYKSVENALKEAFPEAAKSFARHVIEEGDDGSVWRTQCCHNAIRDYRANMLEVIEKE